MNFKDFLREGFFRPDRNLVSDPGYLYHATNEENLMDIKASGRLDVFGPSHGTDQDAWPDGGGEERSYWTARASSAWHFSPEHGRPVILRVPKSPKFRRESGTGDYYATAPVPVDLLEVMMSDGSWSSVSAL